MNIAAAERLVPVAWNGDVRELVDLFSEACVFEASPAQRAEIALRAEAMLASSPPDAEAVRDLKFDLLTADWKTRAEAAARLSGDGAWTPWDVAGSLGVVRKSGTARREASRAASAIVVAARETLSPDLAERHERLKGPVRVGAAHEKD
ncbi:MAG TPA: hypothetical protein VJ694_02245, partial [Patescibacteria group bacterium]|nr:hypothetical protein [Patescibacteria group bacterium]